MKQPVFSIIFANLCQVMSPIEIEWENVEDGTTQRTSFYRLLLNKVQQKFENHGNDKHIVSLRHAIGQANTVGTITTKLFTIANLQ